MKDSGSWYYLNKILPSYLPRVTEESHRFQSEISALAKVQYGCPHIQAKNSTAELRKISVAALLLIVIKTSRTS